MAPRPFDLMKLATVILACFVASAAAQDKAADVKALVERMPAFAANSMFEGPERADAEKLFEQILAGGAPAVTALVDMVAPPPAENFKPRYVLHGMAQYLGEPRLAEKRRLFVGALAAALGGERPKWVQGFVARQLQVVGDANAAPALGRLLGDEENCEYAAQALSAIGGTAAAAELRKALPRAKAARRLAIIRGLGECGDKAAAGDLAGALADADREVRIASGTALGRIGDAATAKTLMKAAQAAKTPFEQAQLTEACLQLGNSLVRDGAYARAAELFVEIYQTSFAVHVKCAALEGLDHLNGDPKAEQAILAAARSEDKRVRIAAAMAAAMATRKADVAAGPAKLKDAAEDARAQYLLSLAQALGYGAMPAMDAGLKDESVNVRKAAVRAMGVMGGQNGTAAARRVLDLIRQNDMDLFGEAMEALSAIGESGGAKPGEVEAEIASRLGEVHAEAKVAMLKLLADLSAREQLPAVLKIAGDEKDETVRAAAIRAVGALGGKEQAGVVIGWVSGAGSDALGQAAEEALVKLGRAGAAGDAVAAATAEAVGKAGPAAKLPLLRALGAMQRDEGLGVLRQNAFGADAEARQIAVRALAEWPSLAVVEDLLKLAKTAEPPALQVLAIRGYVRLIPDAKSDDAKLAMCREAMSAAKRPDEKRAVLGVLAKLSTAASVELAAAQLDEKDLARDAAGAVIGAAKGMAELTPAVRAAVAKAVEAAGDKRLIGEGQKLLAPEKK